jgi:hypothetical protein
MTLRWPDLKPCRPPPATDCPQATENRPAPAHPARGDFVQPADTRLLQKCDWRFPTALNAPNLLGNFRLEPAMRRMTALLVLLAAAPLSAQQTPANPTTAPPRPTMLKPADIPTGDGTQPRQRMVTVFGNEACPKPSSVDEVIVCARLPESEIYRIPEPLRRAENRQSVLTQNRKLLLGDSTGGAGGSIGSCSAVGPGGMIGCNRNQVEAWAQDRTNRMGYNEQTPR